jgi:cephalosporin hydroxylase
VSGAGRVPGSLVPFGIGGALAGTESLEAANDFVGYEVLVDFIEERALHELPGDLIEIGAFLGGGTAKLARFAHKYGKKVLAIDVFDPEYDRTCDTSGARMCDIYRAFLAGRSQREVYDEATRDFDNVITIEKDSREVELSERQQLIFGFIDGNHHPDHVRSDFHLVWRHLMPGGCVGFHDYDFDLPEVTEAIDRLIEEHRAEIEDVHRIRDKTIVLLTKAADSLSSEPDHA